MIKNKVVLITGATGAIGKAIAKGIAQLPEYVVYLICRNEKKAMNAVKELKQHTGNENIDHRIADISSYASIQKLRAEWNDKLHILINNASDTPAKRIETREGLEVQFATNILGYFRMIYLFQRILRQDSPSRVINIASYWAGDMDMDDLEFKKRRYNNNTAYRQSKQANRMLTVAFAERLRPYGIYVNACHPGDVNSALSNSLGFGGHETPEEGAHTPIWLATGQIGGEKTGKYFEYKQEKTCQFVGHKKNIENLYSICEKYI